MTACVNRKHTKKVAAVVTASLVGALSLGVAPVAAMATDEGIDMQLAPGDFEDGTEFAQGDVVLDFEPAFRPGNISTDVDAKGVTTVTADQIPFTVSTTEVKLAGSSTTISVVPGTDFRVALYKANEEGEPEGTALSGNRVVEAGDYVLTVTPLDGSEYTGQTFAKLFKVIPADIAVDAYFEHGDLTDTRLSYTGSALDLGFANDGEALEEGVDYTVRFSKKRNADGSKADGKYSDEIVDAGTYDAVITGIGKYEGSSTVYKGIKVDPYDLTAAYATFPDGIVVAPFKGTLPEHPDRVFYHEDGTDNADVDLDTSLVNIKFADGVNSDGTMPAGAYQVAIRVDEDALASGNVLYNGAYSNDNPIKVNAVKVDEFCDFTYAGQPLQDSYDVFLGSDAIHQFDWNAVDATFNGSYIADATVLASDYNPYMTGTYTITFGYNTTAGTQVTGNSNTALNGKVFAGTKTVTVHVWAGAIDADTGLWAYGPDSDTVAIQSYSKAYDGFPLTAAHFHVGNKDNTVNTDNGLLEAKLYKADGTEVDYAIEAGEYYLEITSDDYKLSGETRLPITIGKVDLTSAEVGKLVKWNDVAGMDYLPLDSMPSRPGTQAYWCNNNFLAIWSLGLVYDTGNDGAAYGEDGYASYDFKGQDLIPANVDVTVERNDNGTWKPVAIVDEAGEHRVVLTVGSDVASNYVLPEGEISVTLEFTVAQKTQFSDVQPDMWYYGAVNAAAAQGYIHGDAGTTTFRPEATIKRGEVAVVLYNMSGVDDGFSANENNSDYFVDGQGWKTGFDDVDGNAYYAKAIAWAKRSGVINGDSGTKNFRPDDTVTNEEFAAMLANYAEKVNKDTTVAEADPASLDDAKGGASVSEWAKKSVAWAVENEIMGNNGADIDAQGSIIRARVAAMCVNYQPTAKADLSE